MAIAVVLDFPGEPVEKYEAVMEAGGTEILNPAGLLHHVCYRTDNGFTVVDVWEDEASFAAFGAFLVPLIKAQGTEAHPVIHPVQGVLANGERLI